MRDVDAGVEVAPEDAEEIWAVLDTYLTNYRMPIEDYLDAHIATCLFPHVRIARHDVLPSDNAPAPETS